MHIGRLQWLVIVFDVNCNSVLSGICTVEENHVHNKLISLDNDDEGKELTPALLSSIAVRPFCTFILCNGLLVIIEFLCNNNNMKQCCINHMLCACPTHQTISYMSMRQEDEEENAKRSVYANENCIKI